MKAVTHIVLTGLTLLAMTSVAAAQSTVSGTLTGGGTNTSTGSSSLSGTVGSGSTLTGTVTSTSTGTTGGGGGAIGNGPPVGSTGGGGSNQIDICPNIADNQSTLPSGYVLSGGNCVLSTTTGGTSGGGTPTVPSSGTGGTTGTSPTVPNTGAGGAAAETIAILAAAAAIGLGGWRFLAKQTA